MCERVDVCAWERVRVSGLEVMEMVNSYDMKLLRGNAFERK